MIEPVPILSGTYVVWDIELIERYWKFFLCNDIEVEPGTEQIIEAKLKNGFEHSTNTPGILEELKELRGKSDINLTGSLVIPRDGLTRVGVPDFSDRPIRLRAHLPVTEYHPVSR